MERVVLVPGLWMPAMAMAYLARSLAAQGYVCASFSHHGRSPLDANVERLARFVRGAAAGPTSSRVHLVGHSFGGVLILETLQRHPALSVDSAVLIGAPARGCQAGRRLGGLGVGRWMMGASRPLWDERAPAWERPAPLGVIAGTVPIGLGRALGRLPGQNDGVVCVAETEVEGMSARALVPLGHSALIISRRVAALVGRFITEGRFA